MVGQLPSKTIGESVHSLFVVRKKILKSCNTSLRIFDSDLHPFIAHSSKNLHPFHSLNLGTTILPLTSKPLLLVLHSSFCHPASVFFLKTCTSWIQRPQRKIFRDYKCYVASNKAEHALAICNRPTFACAFCSWGLRSIRCDCASCCGGPCE